MKHHDFPEEILEAGRTYGATMEAVKQRINALTRTILRKEFFDTLPHDVAFECCYLQLRLISEFVARACVVANGDVANSKFFRGRTDADAVMNALAKIHPEFYPVPEYPEYDEQGRWTGIQVRHSGFITRRQLTKLYSDCGERLHARKIKSKTKHINFADEVKRLRGIVDGLINLLARHTMVTVDPKVQFFMNMGGDDDGGLELTIIHVDESPEWFQELAQQRARANGHG